nr:MAG TPA: hypothetical protein [Crassvirales sp.]
MYRLTNFQYAYFKLIFSIFIISSLQINRVMIVLT